ncbi:MAG: glycosyltransferase family 2 protein [Turicibacter sp.]|nr:glycosyltransferase family 2 protein [Turicibacter sp.]
MLSRKMKTRLQGEFYRLLKLRESGVLADAVSKMFGNDRDLENFFESDWPDRATALRWLAAQGFRSQNDYGNYLKLMMQIAIAYPTARSPYTDIAREALRQKNYDTAVRMARKALAIKEKQVAFYKEDECFASTFLNDCVNEAILSSGKKSEQPALERKRPAKTAVAKSATKKRGANRSGQSGKVSIVILCHNQLAYTQECLDSIRRYTPQAYELIIIDNASTDGTVAWLEAQPDVVLIKNKENLGFPKGCNQGIEKATGAYILLLNNDVVVTENWLGNLLAALNSSPKIGAVGPITNSASYETQIPTGYGTNMAKMQLFARLNNKSQPDKWEERLKLIGFCLLIKKRALNKAGTWLDERFTPGNFEDDDISLRLLEKGYKLLLCRDCFIHHYGSASFSVDRERHLRLLEGNNEKFRDKWGFFHEEFLQELPLIESVQAIAPARGNILHIGAGLGATLLLLKQQFPGPKYYGLEPSPAVAKFTAKVADVANVPYDQLGRQYPGQKFSCILISKKIPAYQSALVYDQATKLLEKNGRIFICPQ